MSGRHLKSAQTYSLYSVNVAYDYYNLGIIQVSIRSFHLLSRSLFSVFEENRFVLCLLFSQFLVAVLLHAALSTISVCLASGHHMEHLSYLSSQYDTAVSTQVSTER